MKRIDSKLITRKRALYVTMKRDIEKLRKNLIKMEEISDKIAAAHALEDDRPAESIAEDVRERTSHTIRSGFTVLRNLSHDFASIPEQSHDN